MTGAAIAGTARSILLGECSDDLQYEVCAQRLTPGGGVELHDIRHVTPRTVDSRTERAFIDLALSHRPGQSAALFPEIRGHRTRRMGDLIFIPAHLRFQSLWSGGRQRSICVVFGEEDDRLDRDWTAEELDAVLDLREGMLRETMVRLAGELVQPGFESALMIEALCTQIAIILRRHLDGTGHIASQTDGRLGAAQVRSIEDMLDDAGPTPSLSELAQQCGLSSRHFGRLFRLTTGQSLTEYATARRIERAKSLLGETATPIKRIAWQCGFQTAAAFSVAFRRATGLQPSAYREARRS